MEPLRIVATQVGVAEKIPLAIVIVHPLARFPIDEIQLPLWLVIVADASQLTVARSTLSVPFEFDVTELTRSG